MHSPGTSLLPKNAQVLRPAKIAALRMTTLGSIARNYSALAKYFRVHDVTAPVYLLQTAPGGLAAEVGIVFRDCHSERSEEPMHSPGTSLLPKNAQVLRSANNAALRMTRQSAEFGCPASIVPVSERFLSICDDSPFLRFDLYV